MLALRGLFGFCALSSFYAAASLMPLADAALLGFLAPVFVATLSPLLLHEPTSKAVFISLPLAMIGVVLVAQPPLIFGHSVHSLTIIAVLIGLSQAAFSASAKLTVRHLGKTEQVGAIMVAMASVSVIVSGVLCLVIPSQHWVDPTRREWAIMGGIGACACAVQSTATMALQRAKAASPVVAMGYSSVIWGMCLDIVVFKQPPGLLSLLGAVFVLAGSAVLLYYESPARREAPPGAPVERDPLLVQPPNGEHRKSIEISERRAIV